MSALPRTAVVTIVRGRADHLRRQRIGLVGQPIESHVVVGMGERPDVRGVPEVPTTVVEIADDGGPLPLAAARNRGAAEALRAGAQLVVFLDVDCIPAPEMVARYRDAVGAHPNHALLCGPVSYLDPPPPEGYPVTRLERWGSPHPGRPNPDPGEVLRLDRWELFWSLSFAVTARHWSTLGGFCEEFRGYGAEDTDFALCAEQMGSALLWVGGADAFHQYHRPARADRGRVAELVSNARLFHARHGFWPMRDWIDTLAAQGVVVFEPSAGQLEVASDAALRHSPL